MPDENPKEGDADHPGNLRRFAELQAQAAHILQSLCRIRRRVTDRLQEFSADVAGSAKAAEEKIDQ